MLGLKQEEEPLPAAEPPPQPSLEPPLPPLAEDTDGGDGSAIIYEIPKEPERSEVTGGLAGGGLTEPRAPLGAWWK